MVTQLQLPHPVPAAVPSGYDNLFTLNTGNDSIAQGNGVCRRRFGLFRLQDTPRLRDKRQIAGRRGPICRCVEGDLRLGWL
jgi:hypothetical protein